MRHRIGGLLIVVGSIGFGALLIFALAGQAIGASGNSLTSSIGLGSTTCGGLGSGLLALDGSARSKGGPARFGLGVVAAALLGLVAVQLLLIFSPIQGDPLASPIILVFIGGYLALLVGQIVVALAFTFRGGSGVITGWLCLAGLAAILLSLLLVGPAPDLAAVLGVTGLAVILVGWLTLGVMAMRGGERPQPVPTGSRPTER